MAFGMMSGMTTKTPERPNIDIVYEYGLIQQKKSKLSLSQRKWVISQFNKNYELIINN
jgi:hypothetical protein